MKKSNYRNLRLYRPVVKLALFLLVALLSQYAKSSPTLPKQRQIAFKRAQMLDNGISISWLEQTWNKDVLNTDGIKPHDLQLLKQLGFKTIRLPVAFRYFEKSHVPQQRVLARIDKVWALCRQYGFRLIIDYHYGDLADSNYLSSTKNIIDTWTTIAKKYLHADANALFYEIYNEPPPMNPQIWKDAAYNIVNAIRKIDKRRTLLVGASNYNSIYELSRFIRLPDENVIYTFHFYEPFLFTHQGAEWVGDQMATTGVPFPYNVEKFPAMNIKAKGTAGEANYNKYHLDGNEGSIKDKLQIVKNWGNKYAVPIVCGEYGSYNKYADEQSRCNYVAAVRKSLKLLNIPGILWDYNTTFSLFNGPPSLANLSDCMKQALGYN